MGDKPSLEATKRSNRQYTVYQEDRRSSLDKVEDFPLAL
jgi:hypothetical protein